MRQGHCLGRLLAPLTMSEFAHEYFQKKPVLIRGASGKFDFAFRQEDFLRNLDRVTEIRAVFPDLWQAVIHPADIRDMFHAGATICVTGMERAHPRLRELCLRVRREMQFAGEVSVRAYLSPPGSGFSIHFDARVSTTLQIAGVKRWWYSTTTATPFPSLNSPRPSSEVSRDFAVPLAKDLKKVLLRPGDLLCLPAGIWHRAEARDTSLALNMAFDHSSASNVDVVLRLLEERLRRDANWRAPLTLGSNGEGRAAERVAVRELKHRIDRLKAELDELKTDQRALARAWRGAFASTGGE